MLIDINTVDEQDHSKHPLRQASKVSQKLSLLPGACLINIEDHHTPCTWKPENENISVHIVEKFVECVLKGV